LQERLSDWTTQQQEQHQARLTGASTPTNGTGTGTGTGTSNNKNYAIPNPSPNSLAEWARTVDLEPLLQRREEIHREKRQGRSFRPNYQQQQQQQQDRDKTLKTPTKEYLTALTKAIQAPSAPNSNNVQVKELYIASKQADQLGEREIAKELLTQLVSLTPNDARLYRRLSRMASEEGNVSTARAILQQGIRRLPKNGYLWQGLGQLELKAGDQSQARKYLRKAMQVDPSLPHAYHALGTLEHTQGRIAEATKILKQGIQYCPTNHRLHHALGDLYRGAKLLDDAEKSYKRALEYSEPVSHCFAFSALAYVAYEKNKIEECRHWLRKSVSLNNGRHAQGWVSLAQLEESEDNLDTARSICIAAITQYERGLIEMKQRHVKQFQQRHPTRPQTLMIPNHEQVTASANPLAIKNQLLSTVPRYRSGDRFLKLYRNWARLEERHGSFENVDEVYGRASHAFPYEYKLTLDWASYHSSMKNSERARTLFMKACNKASNKYVYNLDDSWNTDSQHLYESN
jgi:tetratricopeptide (TPR) repeat protein